MRQRFALLTSAALLAGTIAGSAGLASPVLADGTVPAEAGAVQPVSSAAAVYPLTEALEAEVKGIFREPIPEGTRIGAVVRLKNNRNENIRVPDYELRVQTSDGAEYTLQPSGNNVKTIQPKSQSELSYMVVVERTDNVAVQELRWTDVDYYVYPKAETVMLAVPVSDSVWDGSSMTINDPSAKKPWGETFRIPSLVSPLEFTPVGISKESGQNGNTYVVQLAVRNPGEQRETVPSFRVDGKTADKSFAGSRVEQDAVMLEAGETKYIHYSIPIEQNTILSSLNVLTLEKFSPGSGQPDIVYPIGRLNIAVPASSAAHAPAYTLGEPMTFDSHNDLIHADIQVSMVEFQMHADEEEGVQIVTAKFKLHNASDRPLATPVFQLNLTGSDGYEYSGKRQSVTAAEILPNSAVTVNYSFTLPQTETGEGLVVQVADAVSAAPYKTIIASYRASLQPTAEGQEFEVYPFRLRMTSDNLSYLFNSQTQQYSYKGKLFFDIEREQAVQVDAAFSRLRFELYDSAGRLVGTVDKPFTGANRLVSGENNLYFNGASEQFASPLTLKVFEVFDVVGGGEAKRLVGSILKY